MAEHPDLPDEHSANAAYVRAVHDRGLGFDLRTMSRRNLLASLTGAGALFLLSACGGDDSTTSATASTTSAGGVTEIESETNGPFPADGSNGIDLRTASGIVRQDITSSFGDSSGIAAGIPLSLKLTVTDRQGVPIPGAAVYVWHCDRDGNYSLYSDSVTGENYLRGIQETGSDGVVSFTSIYPACYSGRWPHIHFEVYSSVGDATSGKGPIRKTSQVAFPEDVSRAVYATDGYSKSVSNLSQVTLSSDNVFGDDDAAHELATVTGSVSAGYTATLTAAIDPAATEDTAPAPGGGGGAPPPGPTLP